MRSWRTRCRGASAQSSYKSSGKRSPAARSDGLGGAPRLPGGVPRRRRRRTRPGRPPRPGREIGRPTRPAARRPHFRLPSGRSRQPCGALVPLHRRRGRARAHRSPARGACARPGLRASNLTRAAAWRRLHAPAGMAAPSRRTSKVPNSVISMVTAAPRFSLLAQTLPPSVHTSSGRPWFRCRRRADSRSHPPWLR